jgi:prepilin-type N-terminal cleavage/methylation domain-containing protein
MRLMRNRQTGFSVTELLVALAIAGVVSAMALPQTARTLADVRLHNDARAIHNLLSLAKMRAASKYTRVRLYCDLANESFVLQTWTKPVGPWVAEEGVESLSSNVSFGFAGVATPPDDTQSTLGQAAACKDTDGVTDLVGTACILFNSRGIPINPSGDPDGNGAIYVTDNDTGVYGVTVSATPLVRLWWSPASITAWAHK